MNAKLKPLKKNFNNVHRAFNPYDIKNLYNEYVGKLVMILLPTMLVYFLKSDVYWAIMTYGFILFMLQDRHYSYQMIHHLNPYKGEGEYYIIPEFVLRGLALGAIITALTHFAGYSTVWVTVCGVGGYCYGYAMNFGVHMTRYNQFLRGLGVAMLVGAIGMNSAMPILPLCFFVVGTFLVAYHFWFSV